MTPCTHRAQHLVSSANPGGRLAIFGAGGLVTSDKGLTWDPTSDTLSVPRLRASEVSTVPMVALPLSREVGRWTAGTGAGVPWKPY